MNLLITTATPLCEVTIENEGRLIEYEWQADRQLAKGLLAYLRETLQGQGKTFDDIQGIGVYKGPGSFTGLRIGLTVVNTLADSLEIPIVGVSGEDWKATALRRLKAGEGDGVVLPDYGAAAHITKPRK